VPKRHPGVKIRRSAPLRLSHHPDSPGTANWRSWALRQEKPRAVDLFCGCGGLSHGLELAGYQVVLAVDNDPWALETHRHNFPGAALELDLSDPKQIKGLIGMLRRVPIDLIASGPPCQPFSRAGRAKIRSLIESGVRSEDDARAHLWRSFLEVVKGVRPTAAFMENVPDLALGDDLATVRLIRSELREAGYEVHTRLMGAWRYGVPQHRQRLILVALRDGRPFEWPKEKQKVTLRDAIGDLPRLRGTTGKPVMRAALPQTPFQKRARIGLGCDKGVVWDHVTRPVRPDDLAAFRLMEPGTLYSELPKSLRRYRSDIFNDKYNRLDWNHYSRAITAHIAKDGYWYIHPQENRTLTVREAARIQTFPDRFRFAGSRNVAFRQIGNAVPPFLAEAIARKILVAAQSSPLPKAARPSWKSERIRDFLIQWRGRDRRRAPWRHSGNTWAAFAGSILMPRSKAEEQFLRDFIARFPSYEDLGRRGTRGLSRIAPKRMRRDISRLARAARCFLKNQGDGLADSAWIDRCGLSSAQVQRLRIMFLGEDGLLASRQTMRVAWRLIGRSGDFMKRVSEGKFRLAELVGSGKNASRVNGALNALGTAICTASNPRCADCPLNSLCASAEAV